MADSSTDRYLDSDGNEIASSPDAVQFGEQFDLSLNGTTLLVELADDSVDSAEIADDAIDFAHLAIGSEARTATDDGTTTGAITAPTAFRTFIAVTSAGATKVIKLPAISAATIGQELYLTVGANGYELICDADDTINLVDADGTNQLDVAANTTVRLVQVSATSWLAETIAATTIAVTAPDND